MLAKADAERVRKGLGLSRPYSDGRLRGRQCRVRMEHELFSRHLIEWSLEDGTRVGLFGVGTSGGEKVRLIVDARLTDCDFSVLETPLLPSSGALPRMRIGPNEDSCQVRT